MPSFQIALSPTKRASGRFLLAVRRALQKALVEENNKRGLTQSDIARELGIHRSVVNKELRGEKDLTLGRLAELAYALGRKPSFALLEKSRNDGTNRPEHVVGSSVISSIQSPQYNGPAPSPQVMTTTSQAFTEALVAAQ